MTPVLAVLRQNLIENKKTQIHFSGNKPDVFNAELIKTIYNYNFDLIENSSNEDISSFDGSIILIAENKNISAFSTKHE